MAFSGRCVFLSSMSRSRTPWTFRRQQSRKFVTAAAKFARSQPLSRPNPSTTTKPFSTHSCVRHNDNGTTINVTYINRHDERLTVQAKEGQNLLDIAVNNKLDLEGFGACGGSLACSTCHLILSEDDYAKLESQLGDDEMDLLDLSTFITDTSRLGCQVVLSKAQDGMVVRVPKQVSDARQLPENKQNSAD